MEMKIALVDDNQSTVQMVSGTLKPLFESRGIKPDVYYYFSGEALENDLGKVSFDLIFLDIEMPQLDGISLAARMREKEYTTPIIFLSNREDRVFDSLQVSPFGFVRKSNFLNDFGKVVNRFIDSIKIDKSVTLLVSDKDETIALNVRDIIMIVSQKKKNGLCFWKRRTLCYSLDYGKTER
ncbi:MAG: response regulator [Bacilli bacterium]